MVVGYEVIRVMGMTSLGYRVCYMRITCAKHALYQRVKQGCDITPVLRFVFQTNWKKSKN